jgi:hypothetical protein
VNGGFIALTDAVDYSAGQGVTKGLHRGGVYKRQETKGRRKPIIK